MGKHYEAITAERMNFQRSGEMPVGKEVSLAAGYPVTARLLMTRPGITNDDPVEFWKLTARFNCELLTRYVEGSKIILGDPVEVEAEKESS